MSQNCICSHKYECSLFSQAPTWHKLNAILHLGASRETWCAGTSVMWRHTNLPRDGAAVSRERSDHDCPVGMNQMENGGEMFRQCEQHIQR